MSSNTEKLIAVGQGRHRRSLYGRRTPVGDHGELLPDLQAKLNTYLAYGLDGIGGRSDAPRTPKQCYGFGRLFRTVLEHAERVDAVRGTAHIFHWMGFAHKVE